MCINARICISNSITIRMNVRIHFYIIVILNNHMCIKHIVINSNYMYLYYYLY